MKIQIFLLHRILQIIANDLNSIDVDKWDYFSRDCHMLGLHHNFQCERTIKLAKVVEHDGKWHISYPKSVFFLYNIEYCIFVLEFYWKVCVLYEIFTKIYKCFENVSRRIKLKLSCSVSYLRKRRTLLVKKLSIIFFLNFTYFALLGIITKVLNFERICYLASFEDKSRKS